MLAMLADLADIVARLGPENPLASRGACFYPAVMTSEGRGEQGPGRPSKQLEDMVRRLAMLNPTQRESVESILDALTEPADFTLNKQSDFATDDFALGFLDFLRIHHLTSSEAFTKDKFEHTMVRVLKNQGRHAELATRGNPGHDVSVDGVPWSLKTQADASIKREALHISKFMELGRGKWEDVGDLRELAGAMFRHMEAYDRIFSLRCLSQAKATIRPGIFEYELVEIPKSLLLRARDGEFVMRDQSRQIPKPGYCSVFDEQRQLMFQLYFDGGTERKLQIKSLSKAYCIVHATWRLKSPLP
jgi:hypothetical protein